MLVGVWEWKFGVGYQDQDHPARRLFQAPCGKDMNMIQGRSSGDTEERMDPRDSEDIESTVFEREG